MVNREFLLSLNPSPPAAGGEGFYYAIHQPWMPSPPSDGCNSSTMNALASVRRRRGIKGEEEFLI
jgi:hypothetical protein